MMASGSWEEFFAVHLPPTDFEDNRSLLKEFCERHDQYGNKIVLVTSGGTTVPLEHNTVRFVDNFSAGTRGSASAEYFLEHGYAVIFMHRQKSLEPFTRHFSGQKHSSGGTTVPLEHNTVRFVDNFSAGTRGSASAEYFLEHGYAVIFMHRQKSLEPFTRHFSGQKLLDMLDIQERGPNTTITVKPDSVDVLAPVLARYKAAHAAGAILAVSFTTVSEYFWLLRAACECLTRLGPRALLYLAAAVSDFYIPKDRVPTHKMQSGSGAPVIQLHLVPKMLAPLVNLWVPEAYVVSFKLETDENLLIPKARAALDKYKHKMVVANLLQTRHHRVILVSPEASQEIVLTREDVHAGVDIESAIVGEIVRLHAMHAELCPAVAPPR